MDQGSSVSIRPILILLFVTSFTNISVCTSRVKIINHGYTDLVVAITEAAPISESNQIIENIKKMIDTASPILYTATHNRTYFKSVKIIIPKSWKHIPSNFSTWETADMADVRIDVPNPLYGNTPYTQQLGGCGEPGEKIHLTPNYVATIGQQSNLDEFGIPGKVFVHEWAHFRYGVFDEYGTPGHPKYPLFYRKSPKSKTILQNICVDTSLSFGDVIDISNNSTTCKIDPVTNLYDNNCRYNFPSNFKPTTSLMSWHKIDSIVYFCKEDQEYHHNSNIPTKHNEMCKKNSVWTVVDNVLNKELGTGATINFSSFPKVDFQILKAETSPRFVMVTDVSMSMSNFSRIEKLGEAVRAWIINDVPEGSKVGMVKFSSKAFIVSDFVEIDENSRKILTDKIPKELMGATCIGCGLKMALKMFLDNQNEKGGIIALVTDGKNTKDRTSINDVTNNIIDAGIRVVTIAFGPEADPDLEKLADLTGGKSYYIRDENTNGQAIRDAFLGALTYQSTISNNDMEFKLVEKQITKSENIEFYVDHSVGRNLKLSIYDLTASNNVMIKLTGPDGQVIELMKSDSNPTVDVTVDVAEVGRWTSEVKFDNLLTRPATVVVTTQLLENAATTITTKCWIPNGANILNATDDPIRIHAEVKNGSQPVIRAIVKAYIVKPNGEVEILDLRDNGLIADTWEDDGVYSKYFTNATQEGRYSVQCQVMNSGTAINALGFIGSASPHFTGKPEKLPNAAIPLENFSRIISSGSFQVRTPVPMDDPYPPGDVKDLSVSLVNQSPTNVSVELQWTAPGDDLDSGIVSFYELKYSDDETALLDSNFDESSIGRKKRSVIMTDQDLIAGSLLPKQAGTPQSATFLLVNVPQGINYYVALRAVDKSHKVSHVSNFGVFFITEPTDSEPETINEMDNRMVILNSNNNSSETSLISEMVAGFGGILIVIVIVLLFVTIFKCVFPTSRMYSVVPISNRSPV